MNPIEFKPVGTIYLHIENDDVVVHGSAGRTSAQLIAPKVPESAAPGVIRVQADATHIHAAGPITLNIPAETAISLMGNADDVVLRNAAAVTVETCQGDLVASELAGLRVTGMLRGDVALRRIDSVFFQSVHQDLAVAHVGSLRGERAYGDVSISHIGDVSIARVDGDLDVTHASSVKIVEIRGDISLSSVAGDADIKHIGGDLNVNTPGTSLAALDVAGDVQMRGPLMPESKHWIKARGDVILRISGNARVTIRVKGDVLTDPDIVVERVDGLVKAQLGAPAEDAAEVEIDALGDVILNSPVQWQGHQSAAIDAELRSAMDEIRKEVRRSAATSTAEAQTAWRGKAWKWDQEGVHKTVGVSVRDIMRDLLRSLNPSISPSPPSPPPDQPPSPASDEVKLILEMLQAGTITAEEAEKLIEALNR